MRLIAFEKSMPVADVTCREEAVYIGAGEGCEITLPDPELAGQVGVVYAEDDNAFVFEQLDASVPVQLNGAAISGKARLRVGDQLKILHYVIRAEADPLPSADRGPLVAVQRTPVARMTRFVQYRLPPGAVIKKTDDDIVVRPAQMTRLGQMNVELAQCNTIEELMERGMATLFSVFGAQRVWIGVRHVNYGPMEYIEGRLASGQTADLPAVGENLKPRVLDRAQFALLPYGDQTDRISLLTGPLVGPDGTLGMVFLDAGETERRYEIADLDFFILLLNTLAAQFDAIFKQIARTRAAMLEGEVAVAHAIQARLTPRKLPQWDELQFGAFREMGRQRTSDIYDIVRLSNDMALFMIAHTSAGGALPSMLMAQAQAAFRVAAMHLDAPHIFLRSLNNVLYDGTQEHPLDCFVGAIEPSTGEVRYARAGRMGAYIISNRGEERALGANDSTPALGLVKNPAYNICREHLDRGESLVLFTPGVVTACNSQGEIFGEERFVNILCDGFAQLASNMLKEMLHDLRQFTQAGTQPDDITVILAHRV